MTFTFIAGPCTVQSREQTLTTARCVAAGGATMLRGGAFKPRTSPHSFRGLGRPALAILAEARAETGLPVEVHPEPEVALCDGPQALTTAEFADFAGDAWALARAVRPLAPAAA